VLFAWGGAVARVPEASTPLAHRATTWVTHPFGVWEDPADDEACVEWVRSFRRAIADHATGGVYLNFIGAEGEDRVRSAFGEATYARLQEVKGQYDPDNVFRGNQNIRPA
jgi:FAD/FMN-containing dehydrogenase